jgi:hypothetical protein
VLIRHPVNLITSMPGLLLTLSDLEYCSKNKSKKKEHRLSTPFFLNIFRKCL